MDLRLCHRRTELILRELFSQMGSAPEGNRLDLVFLRQMIPHHLGAARMAQNTLRYQVATGLAPVLRSTIDTHCKADAGFTPADGLSNRVACFWGRFLLY